MNAADAPRRAKLRLIRSANVGPVTYAALLRRFGSAEAALDAVPMLAARGGGRAVELADPRAVEAEFGRVAALGARHIFIDEPDYPPLLREIESAPPAIIVRGDAGLAARSVVAMSARATHRRRHAASRAGWRRIWRVRASSPPRGWRAGSTARPMPDRSTAVRSA